MLQSNRQFAEFHCISLSNFYRVYVPVCCVCCVSTRSIMTVAFLFIVVDSIFLSLLITCSVLMHEVYSENINVVELSARRLSRSTGHYRLNDKHLKINRSFSLYLSIYRLTIPR